MLLRNFLVDSSLIDDHRAALRQIGDWTDFEQDNHRGLQWWMSSLALSAQMLRFVLNFYWYSSFVWCVSWSPALLLIGRAAVGDHGLINDCVFILAIA